MRHTRINGSNLSVTSKSCTSSPLERSECKEGPQPHTGPTPTIQAVDPFSSISDLPVDENGRLAEHFLLVPPHCFNTDAGFKVPAELPQRRVALAEGELEESLVLRGEGQCAIVALEVGCEPFQLNYVLFVGEWGWGHCPAGVPVSPSLSCVL